MRKILSMMVGLLLFCSSLAMAQNAHFIGTPKAFLTEDSNETPADDLGVSFKEAGVGSNVLINFTVAATVSGSCACVSKSGNCPAAANKFPPTSVFTPATLPSGKNGNIVDTIISEEPECQQISPSTCPRGQTNTLVSVTYDKISLTDATNNVSSPTSPLSVSATFATCP